MALSPELLCQSLVSNVLPKLSMASSMEVQLSVLEHVWLFGQWGSFYDALELAGHGHFSYFAPSLPWIYLLISSYTSIQKITSNFEVSEYRISKIYNQDSKIQCLMLILILMLIQKLIPSLLPIRILIYIYCIGLYRYIYTYIWIYDLKIQIYIYIVYILYLCLDYLYHSRLLILSLCLSLSHLV